MKYTERQKARSEKTALMNGYVQQVRDLLSRAEAEGADILGDLYMTVSDADRVIFPIWGEDDNA